MNTSLSTIQDTYSFARTGAQLVLMYRGQRPIFGTIRLFRSRCSLIQSPCPSCARVVDSHSIKAQPSIQIVTLKTKTCSVLNSESRCNRRNVDKNQNHRALKLLSPLVQISSVIVGPNIGYDISLHRTDVTALDKWVDISTNDHFCVSTRLTYMILPGFYYANI